MISRYRRGDAVLRSREIGNYAQYRASSCQGSKLTLNLASHPRAFARFGKTGRTEALKDVVFLSSVTDPYQPPEHKYKLTRSLLEVLLEYQVPLSILTKSDLVVRDIDLLKQFEHCNVGLSLMTLDDRLARRLEPRAVPPSQRLKALHTLRESGIHTYGFVSPYLPGLSDINQLMEALSGSIDEIGVEAINTRGGNWLGVEKILAKHHPELLDDCKRLSKDDHCWHEIERQLIQLAKQCQIKVMGFYRHSFKRASSQTRNRRNSTAA